MKALVIGATGATGTALVQQLLQNNNYHEVVVFVRRKSFPPNAKLTEVIVDFDHLQNYAHLITGDVAFSCLGTTLKMAGSKQAQWKVDYDYQYNFACICADNQVKKMVLLSAIGANANSFFFYNKLKGSLEEAVKKLSFSCILIFQPGSLIRPDSDRFAEKISVKLLLFLNKIGILKNLAPISVRQLAQSMQLALNKFHHGVHIISLKKIMEL